MLKEAEKYLQLIGKEYYKSFGKVAKVVGLTIESIGPEARLNDLCKIYLDKERVEYVSAEVVGFHDSHLILMPFDNVEGVGVRSDSDWNRELNAGQMHALLRSDSDHHDTEQLVEGLPYGICHAELMANFARHIRLGEPLIATGLDGLRQVELANAIALSGWLQEAVPNPCDSARYDAELQKRMDEE